MVREWSCGDRSGHIFGTGGKVVYINISEADARDIRLRIGSGWTLVSVENNDWNRDLSPWPGRAAFRGQADFSGGAPEYLRELVRIIPEIERALPERVSERMIAGYSMAGLFALYAAMSTDLFCAAASASGSLWYDGFTEWMKTALRTPKAVYLSVGEREKRGRNPLFHAIEDCTREVEEIFRLRGAKTCFELRPGGHFDDPKGWLAKAVLWLLEQEEQEEKG